MLEVQEKTPVWSLGQAAPLEEGMATFSSIPAWRIALTEEPGGLQSKVMQRGGHNWVTKHTLYDSNIEASWRLEIQDQEL